MGAVAIVGADGTEGREELRALLDAEQVRLVGVAPGFSKAPTALTLARHRRRTKRGAFC